MNAKANDLAAKHSGALAGMIGLNRTAPIPPPGAASTVDKYGGATKSRNFGELAVDLVEPDPDQPRKDFDEAELQLLADSIRVKKQMTPIRVRPGTSAGRWVIIAGERRYRACKLAGLATVRVEFVEGELSAADILEEQILENVARADFKPFEEGLGYRRLMGLRSWSVKDLITELKVEHSRVYRALGVARLPDDVGELVDAQAIRPTAAYEISKLDDPEDQRAVAKAVMEHQLDHKSVVKAVERRKASAAPKPKVEDRPEREGKGRAPAKPQRPTFEVFRVGGAKVTVEFRKAVEPRVVLDALREATDRQQARVDGIEGADREVA